MYRSAGLLEREPKTPVTRLRRGPPGGLQIGATTTGGAAEALFFSPPMADESDRLFPDFAACRRRALP